MTPLLLMWLTVTASSSSSSSSSLPSAASSSTAAVAAAVEPLAPPPATAALTLHTDAPPVAVTSATPIGLNLDWWANNATNNENVTGLWDDASLLAIDLRNPRLKAAVRAFGGGAVIRMGGTLGDEIGYDVGEGPVHNCPTPHAARDGNVSYCLSMARWDELHGWCAEAGCRIAFGLNALYGRAGNPRHSFNVSGPWDATNAAALLEYTAKRGYSRDTTLFGFELGNELQDDLPAPVLAAQYRKLSGMIDRLWPNVTARPWIIGPDENPDGKWLHEFLQASGGVVRAVTYHQYSGFGGDANLSAQLLTPAYWHNPVHTLIWNGTSVEPPVQPDSAPSIQQAFNAYQQGTGGQPRAELWVGETAAAWDSGKPGVTNAFVDSFWFVTQLGSLAQVGVATQCRQSLVGGAYELLDKHTFQPNPDYYIALLWTRLMGRRVIGVTQPGPDTSTPLVRAYAHCSSEGDEEGGGAPAGSIAVAIINADSSATARVDLRGLTQLAPRQEYRLTAPAAAGGGSTESQLHSRSVALNGKTLDMAEDGSLPPLVPVVVTNATEVLVVHPLEIIFVVFEGADAASCKVL